MFNILFGLLCFAGDNVPAEKITVSPYEMVQSQKKTGWWIKYKITSADYKNGIIPEDAYLSTNEAAEYIDGNYFGGKRALIFGEEGRWHLRDNCFNSELTVECFFANKDKPEDWKKVILTIKGQYISNESKKIRQFSNQLYDIPGIVGYYCNNPSEGNKWHIRIADRMRNIDEIVLQIKELTNHYGYKISCIELMPNYDFMRDGKE
jgi:hypothetical protein